MRLIAACLALLSIGCSTEAAKTRHFDRGQQYLAAGKLPEAIIEFRNAVDRDELWGEARYQLAEAYAAHAEPELAYKQYIRAADLLPDDARVQLKAVAYLLLAGQHEDAKVRAERVLEKHPGNIDALVALGSALAGLRDLEGAITQITEAIQLDPTRSQSYMTLAQVRVAQGRADEAGDAFDKAVTSDGRSVAAHLARANFQWSIGDLTAAEKSLERILEIEDGNVLTHRLLATLYLGSARHAKAERHLKFVADTTGTAASRLNLVDYYVNSGRYDAARSVLSPLVATAETRGAAGTRLANILYSEGLTTEGQRLLDAVLAREPDNEIAHLLNARWLLAAGGPQRALEHARSALAVSPQMIPALYIKAEAEMRTHRTAEAMTSLRAALRVNPRDTYAQTQLSTLHLARNEIDSALTLAEEALSHAPTSVDARLALAHALMARGDLKAAAAEIALVRARESNSVNAQITEGALRLRLGDQLGARAAFERALELDATSREALKGLTTLDGLQNKITSARARIESRLASFDNDSELLLLYAKVLLADGDAARAEAVLRRAIVLDPLDVESFALLARVLTHQQKLDASLAAFDNEVRREPGNLAAQMMGALVAHTQGKMADAKTRYQAILKLEPRAALAANNLASIYAEEGNNLFDAQRLAESAAEQLPTHAGIQHTLGFIYLRQQLFGPAIMRLRQSVAAAPNNALYHYHLSLALSKSGDTHGADESLRRAVTLDPRFSAAQGRIIDAR
jgi:tetratricopeptide (TPR) repeat protein